MTLGDDEDYRVSARIVGVSLGATESVISPLLSLHQIP